MEADPKAAHSACGRWNRITVMTRRAWITAASMFFVGLAVGTGVVQLSGEVLYTDDCREGRDCGGGNNMRFDRRSITAFDQAINGQEVDVEKVK